MHFFLVVFANIIETYVNAINSEGTNNMLSMLRSVDYEWMIHESLQVYHGQMDALLLPLNTEEMMKHDFASQQEALEHFRSYNPDCDIHDKFQRKLQVRVKHNKTHNLTKFKTNLKKNHCFLYLSLSFLCFHLLGNLHLHLQGT